MKQILWMSLALLVFSSSSYADTIYGTLGSKLVKPVCDPGKACPQFVRLQYFIHTSTHGAIDIETSDFAIMKKFSSLKGELVRADGTKAPDGNELEVTAITEVAAIPLGQ